MTATDSLKTLIEEGVNIQQPKVVISHMEHIYPLISLIYPFTLGTRQAFLVLRHHYNKLDPITRQFIEGTAVAGVSVVSSWIRELTSASEEDSITKTLKEAFVNSGILINRSHKLDQLLCEAGRRIRLRDTILRMNPEIYLISSNGNPNYLLGFEGPLTISVDKNPKKSTDKVNPRSPISYPISRKLEMADRYLTVTELFPRKKSVSFPETMLKIMGLNHGLIELSAHEIVFLRKLDMILNTSILFLPGNHIPDAFQFTFGSINNAIGGGYIPINPLAREIMKLGFDKNTAYQAAIKLTKGESDIPEKIRKNSPALDFLCRTIERFGKEGYKRLMNFFNFVLPHGINDTLTFIGYLLDFTKYADFHDKLDQKRRELLGHHINKAIYSIFVNKQVIIFFGPEEMYKEINESLKAIHKNIGIVPTKVGDYPFRRYYPPTPLINASGIVSGTEYFDNGIDPPKYIKLGDGEGGLKPPLVAPIVK